MKSAGDKNKTIITDTLFLIPKNIRTVLLSKPGPCQFNRMTQSWQKCRKMAAAHISFKVQIS